jgi:hypothetical protein
MGQSREPGGKVATTFIVESAGDGVCAMARSRSQLETTC